jgi:hypothetical protein
MNKITFEEGSGNIFSDFGFPLLGNISPIEMMAFGKEKKVFRMIKNSIEGNNP